MVGGLLEVPVLVGRLCESGNGRGCVLGEIWGCVGRGLDLSINCWVI